MPKHEMVKVAEDALDRCQAAGGINQCRNRVVEGTKYCAAHSGASIARKNELKDIKRFQKSFLYEQMKLEGNDGADLKSLKGEILLLRVLQQTIVNSCKNGVDVMMQSAALADLCVKSEKLITSCHRLDKDLLNLIDKDQLLAFAGEIVEIMCEYIPDNADRHQASLQVHEAFQKATEENIE